MEIALISDQHFGVNSFCPAQHKSFALFYDSIFFPTLKKRNIKTVIDLGDTFDRAAKPDKYLIGWAKKNYFDKLLNLGIQLFVLRGNHNPKRSYDGKLVDAITSVGNDYSNIHLIDDPKLLTVKNKNILLAPFIDHKLGRAKSSGNYKKNFDKYFSRFSDSRVDLIMTHLAFSRHKVFENKKTSGGFNKSMKYFKDLKVPIITGHFHPRSFSTSPTVFYLGAPYALKRSEFNVSRGFHLLDSDSLKINFIENVFQVYNYKLVHAIDDYVNSLSHADKDLNEYTYVIPNLSHSDSSSSSEKLNSSVNHDFIEFIDTPEKLQSFIQVLIFRKEYNIAKEILEHSLPEDRNYFNLLLQYVFVLMGINTPESNAKAIRLFNQIIASDAMLKKKAKLSEHNDELFALLQTLSSVLYENSYV